MIFLSFSDNLKKLREQKTLSQSKLAAHLNIPVSSYANWENGKEPKYEMLIRLAEFFNVSVDELIGAKGISEAAQLQRDFEKVKTYFEKAGFTVETRDTKRKDSTVINYIDITNPDLSLILHKEFFTEIVTDIIAISEQAKDQTIINQMKLFMKQNGVKKHSQT